MKLEEMPYERIDLEETEKCFRQYGEQLKDAKSFMEANEAFLKKDMLQRHVNTMHVLCQIRHDVNTKDAFYNEETSFWNGALPKMEGLNDAFNEILLESKYRPEFEKEYGEVLFKNLEIAKKAFSPEIMGDMEKENETANAYEDLLASARIPFEGGVYTIAQMSPFKNDADDERRRAAWIAEGKWYEENREQLDDLFDQLVRLRTDMAKKMGYENYTELAYYRMGRNCYTRRDIEEFRKSVVKYVVPVAEALFKQQAERLGKSYPMSFADNALEFRSGNPKPVGDANDVLDAGSRLYKRLSKETDEWFTKMREMNLMDVLAKENKRGGGYMDGLPDYDMPIIFANFNGTEGDVTVITHEGGHAFEYYVNAHRKPIENVWPTMEGCEIHSMSMEFFGELASKDFFGKDAKKFRYSHLASAIKFIPYGTMVDHFQHEVYDHPEYTKEERHAVWKKLLGIYQPWMNLNIDIPFYSEGHGWQRQHHIYSYPFYYIDYCIAQTASLEFWSLIQKDEKEAWEKYMDYTRQGGSDTFINMLHKAGVKNPLKEETIREVCDETKAFIDTFDFSDIK